MDRLLKGIVAGGFMLMVMKFWVIPQFFNDFTKMSQDLNARNMANYKQAMAANKSRQQQAQEAKLAEATKPLQVENSHKGYILRNAEVRTCYLPACTIVGKLPTDTLIGWNEEVKGFVRYDNVHWVKLSDVKVVY